MAQFTCDNCGVAFTRAKAGKRIIRFCSHACYIAKCVRGRTVSSATRAKLSTAKFANNPMKGTKHTKATRAKMRAWQATNPQGTGSKAINWQGGQTKDKNGYILVYAPWHPNAVGNYVPEHRLIVSQLIGRKLRDDEEVHHTNEIVDDNRPENLELLTTSTHMRHHRLTEVARGVFHKLRPTFGR